MRGLRSVCHLQGTEVTESCQIWMTLTIFAVLQSVSDRMLLMLSFVQGTIEGHAHSYQLDQAHTFEKGKPSLVCGNTAGMLGEDGLSWLASHFKVCSAYFSCWSTTNCTSLCRDCD